MPNTYFPNWAPSQLNAEFAPKASLAVGIGDLLYWDTVTPAPLPFSQLADQGTAAKQQAKLAPLFVGVANSARLASDAGVLTPLRVLIDGIWEFACDSSTFAIGDYVGASYNTNVARDQQVAKVAGAHMAIGRVIKRYASATTKVKVRLMSRYLLGFIDPFIKAPLPIPYTLTTLADQDNTLTVDTLTKYLKQTPTANPRKLIMPTEALCGGIELNITNLTAMTNGIQVRDSGDAATVVTVAAAKSGIVWCDGTTWRGICSA